MFTTFFQLVIPFDWTFSKQVEALQPYAILLAIFLRKTYNFFKEIHSLHGTIQGKNGHGVHNYERLFYYSKTMEEIDPKAPSILRLNITKSTSKVNLPKSCNEK
jgi:hypothetical protein